MIIFIYIYIYICCPICFIIALVFSIYISINSKRTLSFFSEEMEMKIGSINTSPINNSTSTIDTQGDGQKLVHDSSFRKQSSHTLLTEIAT